MSEREIEEAEAALPGSSKYLNMRSVCPWEGGAREREKGEAESGAATWSLARPLSRTGFLNPHLGFALTRPRLHRCVSLPEVRQAAEASRSVLDADNVRLRLRLARKEAADGRLRRENLALREENEALRARIRTMEASEQRSVAEGRPEVGHHRLLGHG